MKSKSINTLFGLLALVAVIAIAPSAFADTAQITISPGAGSGQACVNTHNCFDPGTLNVAKGTTVTWTNGDNTAHTVTSGKYGDNDNGTVFNADYPFKPKQTMSHTFNDAGTFDYFCSVHPWMTGQVIVGGAAATTSDNATASNNATVPEFGPVASIVLAIAVMSMIVFVAKTRAIPKL